MYKFHNILIQIRKILKLIFLIASEVGMDEEI